MCKLFKFISPKRTNKFAYIYIFPLNQIEPQKKVLSYGGIRDHFLALTIPHLINYLYFFLEIPLIISNTSSSSLVFQLLAIDAVADL